MPEGLTVHAVVGSCAPEAAARAVTAAVAAGLAGRSRRRVVTGTAAGTGAPGVPPARSRLGLHLPAGLGATGGGLRVAVGTDLDLVRLTAEGIAGPALRVRLRIAGDGRWLLGGPDPARTPGPRPLALRALTLDLTLALSGWGRAEPGGPEVSGTGRLVLHDASAFGIRRARWTVDLSETAPLLPEVRALLGGVAAQLDADPDETVGGLVAALRAAGDAAGGFDATTLGTLLPTSPASPRRPTTSARGVPGRRVAHLVGTPGPPNTRSVPDGNLTADLSARTLTVSAVGEPRPGAAGGD